MWVTFKKQKVGWLTEESEHEDAIISYPQLVRIFKLISGHKLIILWDM